MTQAPITSPADSPITAWIELPPDARRFGTQFVFARPIEVWQADEITDVRSALTRVAQAQSAGFYVAGFVTYEASPAFDSALVTPSRSPLPLAWFAAFREPTECLPPPAVALPPPSEPVLLTTEAEYSQSVRRALEHIRAGDIYQVNYTVRADLDLTGCDGYSLFRALLDAVPMPRSAYIDTGEAQIVSLSPELFLRRVGDVIESRPMKGTASRRPSWPEDEAARLALAADEKNCAENVMIVDLMRNDLGRICRAGTVTVPERWRVDRFPTVHQMTSLVRGRLEVGTSLFDIFAATFPPGSVTGAPKVRACQIIAELESEPRGIYCGTIGLFFPGGDFELNVAIRTLTIHPSSFILHPSAVLGIGSGIVADSDPAAEWKETLLKGRFVARRAERFAIYETIRYQPGVPFEDLLAHLHRLRQSCFYFGRCFPLRRIVADLHTLRRALDDRPARIRLDVEDEDVRLEIERINLTWPEEGMIIQLADERLDPEDPRLYHKTTLRPEKYHALEKARACGAYECLFLNMRGEITEGALSNILLKIGGQWLTPALGCGLLPGVWREKQLRRGRCREAVLTPGDLADAEEVRMMNAVRGEGIVRRVIASDGSVVYEAAH